MKNKNWVVVATIAAALSWVPLGMASDSVLTKDQEAAVGEVVKSYLLEHPEVVIEAVQNFQVKQQQKQISEAEEKIKAHTSELFDNTKTPHVGQSDGHLVLVEFYDFRCTHCREVSSSVDALLKDHGQLKVIYKDFPIFSGPSMTAAKASLAAYALDPKKYQAFHHALMAFNGELQNKDIMNLAKESGYDENALTLEMKKSWVEEQIKANFNLGTTIGVNATPMFVLANTKTNQYVFIPGAVSEKALNEALSKLL